MNIFKTELFPYIEGQSLVGKSVTLTMTTVTTEMLKNRQGRDEKKYILYFQETPKGLVLNKTNAKRIANLYGAETDAWAGKRITIYAEPVRAFGEDHNAVRVAPAIPTGNGHKQQAEPMPVATAEQSALVAWDDVAAETDNYYTGDN